MFIVHSYSGSIGDFESFGGGPTPSWTTKDVKVQFLRSRVNCVNKLNHNRLIPAGRLISASEENGGRSGEVRLLGGGYALISKNLKVQKIQCSIYK